VLRWFSRHSLLERDDARQMLAWESSGFLIDATVCIAGSDRAGLQLLLRYCARPQFALERIEQVNENRILYRFPKPQRDGRTQFTPLELIDHLAALIRRHARTVIATMACWHPVHRYLARPPPMGATLTSVASNHCTSALRTRLPVRQGCAGRPTTCGPCCAARLCL
jgi:hypothetical protein